MTKEELFELYNVNETHSVWNNMIDNWMGVEIYRIMHNGQLPGKESISWLYLIEFLKHGKRCDGFWRDCVMSRDDWGSLFLTAKRTIFRFADEILKELNE